MSKTYKLIRGTHARFDKKNEHTGRGHLHIVKHKETHKMGMRDANNQSNLTNRMKTHQQDRKKNNKSTQFWDPLYQTAEFRY